MTINIYNRKSTEPTVYRGVKYFIKHSNGDLVLYRGMTGSEKDYIGLILNENILYFSVMED